LEQHKFNPNSKFKKRNSKNKRKWGEREGEVTKLELAKEGQWIK
jgi:hypothetical protein